MERRLADTRQMLDGLAPELSEQGHASRVRYLDGKPLVDKRFPPRLPVG